MLGEQLMKLSKYILVLTFIVSSPCLQAEPSVLNRVIASANGTAITESELSARTQLLLIQLNQSNASLPPQAILQKQLLERLILEKLQIAQATPEEKTIEEHALNQQIQQIAAQDNFSVEQLQAFLQEQGVPFSTFKTAVKNETIMRKVQQREIAQQISVSESDIQNFLNSPASADQIGTEYHLAHILIPISDYAEANEIAEVQANTKKLVQELRTGANFSKVAMEKSSGQQALDGGDLGWYKADALPSLFDSVVPTLSVNEIHGPIQESGGFHIIKLLGVRNTEATTAQQHHVYQIMLKADANQSDEQVKARLSSLRQKITDLDSFTTLAKEHSDETSSAPKGGDLGWISQDSTVPAELIERCKKLKPGETSEPFKTKLGWHIIQAPEVRRQKIPTAALKQHATEILFGRKFEKSLGSWLKHLRADAEVKIYLDENH